MKKINVIVKDKTTLELVEDATKGDIIDLTELVELDLDYINKLIDSKKDSVYQERLAQFKLGIDAQYAVKISELENHEKMSIYELQRNFEQKVVELREKHKDEIDKLNNSILDEKRKYELMVSKTSFETETKIKELESTKEKEYLKLDAEFKQFKNEYLQAKENIELKLKNEYETKIRDLENKLNSIGLEKDLESTKKLQDLKNSYESQLQVKQDEYNTLLRQKAAFNVKQTGEDLESWCDNEMTSYMQNGFQNCTWMKDNVVVKEEDEGKGSKADYIFKVYASDNCQEDTLLTSVCLEMKDENPDSKNKQTNEHYFNKLDLNRKKKNCKYAVLVSNLETDKPNVIPVYKAKGYEDMYVVRPAYMVTFLNMLVSLSVKFQGLLLENYMEQIDLKSKTDLIEQFNAIKNTYLEKPLAQLEKEANEILKQAEVIDTASGKIKDQAHDIINKYMRDINDKISKYEVEFRRKVIKKLPEEE